MNIKEYAQIELIPIDKIKEYEKNPRKNSKAVDIVKKSINEFGFKNPIILDKNNVIICGHTRLLAAKELDYNEVPVIYAKDLTPNQVKAFRIMDNKSQEYSEWDLELLKSEIEQLDTEEYDVLNTGLSLDELTGILDNMKVKQTNFKKHEIRLVFDNENNLKKVYNQIEPILSKNSIKIKMDKKVKEILNMEEDNYI